MPHKFAESFLIELLGHQLLLDSSLARDARRGIQHALADFDRLHAPVHLHQLAQALQRHTTVPGLAFVDLLGVPLTPLWVRAALQSAREKIAPHPQAYVIIVGLWEILKIPCGRRTPAVERRFNAWRTFVEAQLAASGHPHLTVLWLG